MTQAYLKDVLALILGGGRGTRLFPLTKMRSKPAVPLGSKFRLIDIPVSNCINSNVMKIFIITQYNSASLNSHISNTYRFDYFSGGFVEILAAEQTPESNDWFQGTADAVRKVFHHLRDFQSILILSGDHLYRMEYDKFLEEHLNKKADLTIAVKPVPPHRASEFGLLKIDERSKVLQFREKPKGDELEEMRTDTSKLGLSSAEADANPFLCSMGIYVFRREVLEKLLQMEPFFNDFGKDVIPYAINHHRVMAYPFTGYWEDIGTIRSYYESSMDLARPVPKFNMFDANAPIYSNQRYLPGCKVVSSNMTCSILGDGCIIDGATIKYSVIGLRSRISANVIIENSILSGNDYYDSGISINNVPALGVAPGSIIRGSILDKNVRVGRNVHIENLDGVAHYDHPDGLFYIRDYIVVIPKGIVLPDGFRTQVRP